jgi:putative hydrolase of the HAD superfamily
MSKMGKKVVVFDLDDTLYYEIDYVRSAFMAIAAEMASEKELELDDVFNEMLKFYLAKKNAFKECIDKYKLTHKVGYFLDLYRNHIPKIELTSDRKLLLDSLQSVSIKMGLLTDGRTVQQGNKIKALGIAAYFNNIIISEEFGSEKPNPNNFSFFKEQHGEARYYYIGDNTSKDFVAANGLGWTTICLLDKGKNIHSQNFKLEAHFLPTFCISEFSELYEILEIEK